MEGPVFAHDVAGPHMGLATYRKATARIAAAWPAFLARRSERLRQGLFGAPVEKVAENILEDLLTEVLDWSLADVNLQIGRADVVLSSNGVKRLVLEVKRPHTISRRRTALDAALTQAHRYAAEQRVRRVAVSDGVLLYAADVTDSGLSGRILVPLDSPQPPLDLWWVSVQGVWRDCPGLPPGALDDAPPESGAGGLAVEGPRCADEPAELLHGKYQLPARCFAFVGRADNPHTWKLPYLTASGMPDTRRLPKAIQAILSNYRGARVDIPRESVGDVLVRLGVAAASLRKLPCQCDPAAEAYAEAHEALYQLDRLNDVGCCRMPNAAHGAVGSATQ